MLNGLRAPTMWYPMEKKGFTRIEQTGNVHNKGGNYIFGDGHADYRKYWERESGDYGLIHPQSKESVPYEPTMVNAVMVLDPAFSGSSSAVRRPRRQPVTTVFRCVTTARQTMGKT